MKSNPVVTVSEKHVQVANRFYGPREEETEKEVKRIIQYTFISVSFHKNLWCPASTCEINVATDDTLGLSSTRVLKSYPVVSQNIYFHHTSTVYVEEHIAGVAREAKNYINSIMKETFPLAHGIIRSLRWFQLIPNPHLLPAGYYRDVYFREAATKTFYGKTKSYAKRRNLIKAVDDIQDILESMTLT